MIITQYKRYTTGDNCSEKPESLFKFAEKQADHARRRNGEDKAGPFDALALKFVNDSHARAISEVI